MADSDRETLEAVAKGYNELLDIQRRQRATMAKMIRACLHRLKSNRTSERKEATDGLSALADMLEEKTDG